MKKIQPYNFYILCTILLAMMYYKLEVLKPEPKDTTLADSVINYDYENREIQRIARLNKRSNIKDFDEWKNGKR